MQYEFGVTQWSLPGNGLYAIRLVKQAGLDGLQLELGSHERGYPLAQARIRDLYLEEGAKYGIQFPSLVLNDLSINNFIHGRNCEKGKIAYEQMKIGIDLAADMQIKVVMIPNFFSNFITEHEHFTNTAEALKYCCDIALGKNITIASETGLNAEEHLKLLDLVDKKNIGVFFDFMNYKFFKKYDQVEILKKVYKRMLPQLHVKDGRDSLSGSLLGEGDMQFQEQIEYMKRAKYSGWFILENYYDQLPLRSKGENDQLLLLIKDLHTLKTSLGV